ncbi:MAG: GDSL-type esterase/lipase family protein [Psychromonas sp.]|nr:GDSL-type esterase/lipase family protein [Psychromonas sp.]
MLQPLNQQQPILAFGDSLTYGYGADKAQSYPAVLSTLINRQVINEGVNGELSAAGLLRLEALLDKHNPQLLLLCHGANDILQQRDLNKMADNLSAMITLAQHKNIQVLLIAVPQVNQRLRPVKQYQEVAARKQVVIDKNLLADLLKQPALHSDIIHPNHLGYQKIAQTIALQLKNQGALIND